MERQRNAAKYALHNLKKIKIKNKIKKIVFRLHTRTFIIHLKNKIIYLYNQKLQKNYFFKENLKYFNKDISIKATKRKS